jgi:hypothetical protein
MVEFDPQKKHFLYHIYNKCCKGKYLSAFPKILPPKMTNKPDLLRRGGFPAKREML